MVEEPLQMKKKDQISFDEQEAIRLQVEFDKEVRLAREKDEANVALIEEWNDIQAKIETDYELAQNCKHRSKKRWKSKDLKSKTELVEGTEMEESSKKAEEAAKMKELMKMFPDEEEVAVDAIPLATKC
ncbi:hypothetical protein Tco_0474430 [Tanacetum coccineum]